MMIKYLLTITLSAFITFLATAYLFIGSPSEFPYSSSNFLSWERKEKVPCLYYWKFVEAEDNYWEGNTIICLRK